jgi:group I intron endonuclease
VPPRCWVAPIIEQKLLNFLAVKQSGTNEQELVVSEKIVGIYAIRNTENGHKYYGSSSDMRKRWGKHRRLLRKGNHFNPYLQAAWNLYGEELFEFIVMERCEVDDLKQLEQEYLNQHPEYNLSTDTSAPRRGLPLPESGKQKLSAHYARLRAEREQWMAEHPGEKPPPIFIFPPQSEETKLKRADKRRGYQTSEETKAKQRASNLGVPHLGARRPRPPEHGQKISAAAAVKRATREQWLLDHPGEELPASMKRKGHTVSKETRQKIAATQQGKPKLSVQAAYARRREERRQWMEAHPGEKPPPIHVMKQRPSA